MWIFSIVAPVPMAYARPEFTNIFDFANDEAGTGKLSRNAFRGPAFQDLDLSYFKNTEVTERIKVTVPAEAFNLFNRIIFIILTAIWGVRFLARQPQRSSHANSNWDSSFCFG